MQLISHSFEAEALPLIKSKVLNWCSQFGTFAYLDNNEYRQLYNRYELLAAADKRRAIESLEELSLSVENRWLFGHLNYDLKNQLHPKLESQFPKQFGNEDVAFFEPNTVVHIPFGKNELIVTSQHQPEKVLEQILALTAPERTNLPSVHFERAFDKTSYLDAVEQVREHIRNGDCYELNLCVAARADRVELNPVAAFQELNRSNPAPFSCLYRQEQHWLICSSPERFLMKDRDLLIAQPMKGTIKRGANAEEDQQQIQALKNNIKERAENIMIADLMRNDLAISCSTASIEAKELFGVYTFPSLHTMISTIVGTLAAKTPPVEALLRSFPMGSMTGAPKHIVMQLIDHLERQRRELYSGAFGYFSPEGDFDFNVVIRSLLYNETCQRLSYQTGGAITFDSDAEAEWEEVLLKAAALEKIFPQN